MLLATVAKTLSVQVRTVELYREILIEWAGLVLFYWAQELRDRDQLLDTCDFAEVRSLLTKGCMALSGTL